MKMMKLIKYKKKYPHLTLAGKMTNKLSNYILPKLAERSEAKSAKRSFASKYLKVLF